jgi:uridine phosphorylase
MKTLKQTELVLNPDGSIYHLNLHPEEISDNIILVGDPDRVEIVSAFFDSVEIKKRKREFITRTGYHKGTRVSVISTGIGTDNIDIVVNEADALANIDLKTRRIRDKKRSLSFIRVGTSGSLQEDIQVDSFVLSELSIGFDNLLSFYKDSDQICDNGFEKAFKEQVLENKPNLQPYVVAASDKLLNKFVSEELYAGVTISAPGFYAPQGRELRLAAAYPGMNDRISKFRHGRHRITNYEMESSAIYGLSRLLGHQAVTVCAVIANRVKGTFSQNHEHTICKLIKLVLNILSE